MAFTTTNNTLLASVGTFIEGPLALKQQQSTIIQIGPLTAELTNSTGLSISSDQGSNKHLEWINTWIELKCPALYIYIISSSTVYTI